MRVAGLGVIAARTTQVVEQHGQRSLCRAEQTVKRSDRDLSEQPNCCIACHRRRCTSLEASVEPAGRCLYEQLRDQVLTFLRSWFLGSDLRWSGERALLPRVVRMAKSCSRPVRVAKVSVQRTLLSAARGNRAATIASAAEVGRRCQLACPAVMSAASDFMNSGIRPDRVTANPYIPFEPEAASHHA